MKKRLLATITIRFEGFTNDGKVHLNIVTLYRDKWWYETEKATKIIEEVSGYASVVIGKISEQPGVDSKSIRLTFQIRNDDIDHKHNPSRKGRPANKSAR